MAPKKKSRKKSIKSKNRTRKKASTAAIKGPKKPARKKRTPKKAKKKLVSGKRQSQNKGGRRSALTFPSKRPRSRSGEQAGDLQGLSRPGTADSESVEELLEEGNAFEADAVIGVEDAERSDEKEVHTHEVPEDDVPSEYLDKE